MTCYSDKITLSGFGDIEKAVAAKLIRNGKKQIAVADSSTDLISFWELSGNSIIHAAISDLLIDSGLTAPRGIAFADFDKNGTQETLAVLATNTSTSNMDIRFFQLSDNSRFYQAAIADLVPPISDNLSCFDLRFIDLSCDLMHVLAVGNPIAPNQINVEFYQKSDSAFHSVIPAVVIVDTDVIYIDGLAFADTNLDGFDDLMAAAITSEIVSDRIEFYRYNAGTWNLIYTLPAPSGLINADIDIADFDHDGYLELAINFDSSSEIHFYKMLSDTIWSDMGCTLSNAPGLSSLIGCETVAFGDLTQQGRIDLITANTAEGLVVYPAYDIEYPFLNLLQLLLCDCSTFPLVNVHRFFENLLFCVDIDSAPVTDITAIFSVGTDGELIPDTEELCAIVKCCHEVEECLTNLYGSDVLNRVSDQWCVTYTGPVRSRRARVDLDNCRVLFEDFYIRCSDGSIIG